MNYEIKNYGNKIVLVGTDNGKKMSFNSFDHISNFINKNDLSGKISNMNIIPDVYRNVGKPNRKQSESDLMNGMDMLAEFKAAEQEKRGGNYEPKS